MQLGSGLGIHYSFEVERAEPPALGDRYRDPRSHLWYVRAVRPERSIKLRDPQPEHPIWEVQLEGEHVAFHLDVGDELEALYESRSCGALYREGAEILGFGTIAREGDGFSWIFRTRGADYEFFVGPLVPTFAAFNSSVFEVKGMLTKSADLPWPLVTRSLPTFAAGPSA
jgi:hypothetical protein